MRTALREEWLSLIFALVFGAMAFLYSTWDIHLGAAACGVTAGLWTSNVLNACHG